MTVAEIQRVSAQMFGIPLGDLLSTSRIKDHVIPRHVAMYLARETKGYSYPRIGRVFHRDHSSVFNGVERIREGIKTDPNLAGQVALLRSFVEARQ